MQEVQSSLIQRASKQLHKKAFSQNLQKSILQNTKTNPLPFIKKGVDMYMNQRKMKKKKKFLQINDSQDQINKSDINMKRYDQIYNNIAQIYKHQQMKKRLLISPNKIVSHQKILQVFQPYKKQFQKLKLHRNLIPSKQQQQTPFSLALKQLGIFYEFESKNKNKMIPSKQINSMYRSITKKHKLKPISQAYIKSQQRSGGNQFLNVEKINLINNDLKSKSQSQSLNYVDSSTKRIQDALADKRKQIQKNVQRIEEFKKSKDFRFQGQIYIRKGYQSNNVESLKTEEQKQKLQQKQQMNSLLKYYPSLKNNLKVKPVTSNGNFSVFSYKIRQNPEKSTGSISETSSYRLLEPQTQSKNYIIGQDDELEEGFYYDKSTVTDPQNPVASTKDSTNVLPSPGKIQRKKKFFNQLPFQTYYYRDLIWKMNYSNDIFVQTPIEYQHRLKAYIGHGNNSSMILGLIKRRIWFAITDKVQQANFVWTQLKILPYFKKQSAGKQIPVLQSSTQQKQKIQYQKTGGILNNKDSTAFRTYFQTYINFQQKSDERLLNRQKSFKYQSTIKINEIKQQKLQNHLINNYVIGNKKALFNTMSNYYASTGQDAFNYLPLTFHIKNGLQDDSWYKFLKYYYKRNKQIKSQNEQSSNKNGSKEYNAWIVKPGQNSNRGNGIQVCLNLQEIKNIVKKKQKYADGSPKTFIVQSYIQKPLLYQKRKFDIRHYMMITCVNGKMKGYFYKDGYVRTTSTQYNLKTNCGKIHLTNDAVQKNLPDYGKYEKGNKISYQQLHNYMSKNNKTKNFDFWGKIYPKMKKIATDVMKACSGGIDPEKLVNNFQVFGMDFMIDSNFDVWLIQVNTNPCLQLSCPLLGSIIPRMVQNALQLTLDCLFPPPVRYTPKGVHYYKNLEKQNRFQLVYDQKIQGLSTSSMDVLDAKMLYEQDDVFEDDGEEWKED